MSPPSFKTTSAAPIESFLPHERQGVLRNVSKGNELSEADWKHD
jgi:hypothetical protein